MHRPIRSLLLSVTLVVFVACAAQGQTSRDKVFKKRLDKAIDKGVKALLAMPVDENGSFPGYTEKGYAMGAAALAIQTLAKCGLDRRHPIFATCWKRVRADSIEAKDQPHRYTYTTAVTMLALEAYYTPPGKKNSKSKKEPKPIRLLAKDYKWMAEMAQWLLANRAGKVWSYRPDQTEDLSNTQYALLGLRAAQRCRVRIDTRPLLEVFDWIMNARKPTEGIVRRATVEIQKSGPRVTLTPEESGDQARGWGYQPTPAQPACNSMTSGGITSLVVLRDLLAKDKRFTKKMRDAADKAIYEGLAWLDKNWTVTENFPRGGNWLYYSLYSLERVGALTRREFIGRRQWYHEGAEKLLSWQASDGSWRNPSPGHLGVGGPDGGRFTDTCFALLFLKRTTVSSRVNIRPPEITQAPK